MNRGYLCWSTQCCQGIDVEVTIKIETKELWSRAKWNRPVDQVGQGCYGIPAHHSGKVFRCDGCSRQGDQLIAHSICFHLHGTACRTMEPVGDGHQLRGLQT